MIFIPEMLMIGGAEKNSGKTSFSEKLIGEIKKSYPGIILIAVKGTVLRDKENPGGFVISEEKNPRKEKDTGRLKSAGADFVYWIRTDEINAKEAVTEFLKMVPERALLLCESNTMRKFIHPYKFIMVKRDDSSMMKSSAEAVFEHVDIFISTWMHDDEIVYEPDLAGTITVDESAVRWVIDDKGD